MIWRSHESLSTTRTSQSVWSWCQHPWSWASFFSCVAHKHRILVSLTITTMIACFLEMCVHLPRCLLVEGQVNQFPSVNQLYNVVSAVDQCGCYLLNICDAGILAHRHFDTRAIIPSRRNIWRASLAGVPNIYINPCLFTLTLPHKGADHNMVCIDVLIWNADSARIRGVTNTSTRTQRQCLLSEKECMRDLTDVALQLALDMKTTPGMPTTIKYIPKCVCMCVCVFVSICVLMLLMTS